MTTAQSVATGPPLPRAAGLSRTLRRRAVRICLVIVAIFLRLTVLAPLVAPYDLFDQDLSAALSPPSFNHLFGADQYGRDVLSRVIYGSRTALLAIAVEDGLALVLGCTLGLVAGFFGGRVDGVVMRLIDVLLASPYLLLALIIVAALGPGLTNSIIAIGTVYTPQYARLLRGQVLAVRSADYVRAARAIGAGRLRIMLRHVLPNSFAPILVMATLQAGSVVVVLLQTLKQGRARRCGAAMSGGNLTEMGDEGGLRLHVSTADVVNLPLSGPHQAFDAPVGLLNDVAEILALPQPREAPQPACSLHLPHSSRVGRVLVHCDRARVHRVRLAQSFAEKALRRGRVPLGREQEVEERWMLKTQLVRDRDRVADTLDDCRMLIDETLRALR